MDGDGATVASGQLGRTTFPRVALICAHVHGISGIGVHSIRRGRTGGNLVDILVEVGSDGLPRVSTIARSHDAAHMDVGVNGVARMREATHSRRSPPGGVPRALVELFEGMPPAPGMGSFNFKQMEEREKAMNQA